MDEFLKQFYFGGLMEIAVGTMPDVQRFYVDDAQNIPADKNVFFGPAMRKSSGSEKTDVLGTKALWVDVDDPQKPLFTLPPSAVVFSGHGWHLYWFLKEPMLDLEQVEALNKLLAQDVQNGDLGCWNCNRVLRVPGTINTKSDPTVQVQLKVFTPNLTYSPDDFKILESLNKAERHRIRTGDARGFRSRSERDWQVVSDLVTAGAEDVLIYTIFDNQPCGDKHRSSDQGYLKRTIEKVREKGPVQRRGAGTTATDIVTGLEEREDGYYIATRRGQRRISTFTIEPQLLLDGSGFNATDAIVGSITANGYAWPDKTFSRSAFTSVSRMDKETPAAAWQFLGHDDDIRLLLPYLLEKLRAKGLPKVKATPVMGLHKIDDKYLFVGDSQVISSGQAWVGFSGPMAWLPSDKEHPILHLFDSPEEVNVTNAGASIVRTYMPELNVPETIWPIIGWYAASIMKPWLEENKYRFPILNVAGTKGAGKTSLIQRAFLPLFGQTDCKSYDANTTRFVVLALLGSANAVPVAFSEFRYENTEKFIRYVLLAYDTGHDPRGRSDQTTVDYPLSAPFSIDGEDLIEDPAARERVVVAHLKPGTVKEGSSYYKAYKEFESIVPNRFMAFYVQECLKRLEDGRALKMLRSARTALLEAFPNSMPDRVRNNHTVAYFGALMFCDVIMLEPPKADVMSQSIGSVFDVGAGRARTLVDSMVEDLANSSSSGGSSFKWKYIKEENALFFQLASGHSWWMASRRRQGRGALERDAIRAQLKEAPYSIDAKLVDGVWMYGIDLLKAQAAGLDVPVIFKTGEVTVRFTS